MKLFSERSRRISANSPGGSWEANGALWAVGKSWLNGSNKDHGKNGFTRGVEDIHIGCHAKHHERYTKPAKGLFCSCPTIGVTSRYPWFF
jgi:hypothetical protein